MYINCVDANWLILQNLAKRGEFFQRRTYGATKWRGTGLTLAQENPECLRGLPQRQTFAVRRDPKNN
jgi:hypothetical protein